ncbi:MAG: OmpA family protein [Muribaculaceae bacterium]|nr:OmpA family protein [Muribaculaceae bacterium]
MKFNKLVASLLLGMGCLYANAQTTYEDVEVEELNPHWYIQAQVGFQETLGEGSFGKLMSPNAQLGVGYRFNSVLGARLILNSWQSKALQKFDNTNYKWKWNYIAPTVDVTVNLTNAFCGFNPDRVVNVGLFAGIGANIGYKNDQAQDANKALVAASGVDPSLLALWDGTKARFLGQFGANLDFNVTRNFAIGLELQANVLPDGYNSKLAHNADWYFNCLVGIKYAFGNTTRKATKKVPVVVPTNATVEYVEKVVEKIVEVPVEKIVEVVREPFRRDIFFTIGKYNIRPDEMKKVEEIAQALKNNPNDKCEIVGYADKGTGTLAINLRLSDQRAQVVAETLINKYGIAPERIIKKSMGEQEYQPYNEPALCRVAMCVVH